MEDVRFALDVISGCAAVGAGVGYAIGMLNRHVFRRGTSLGESVMHGAGIGFILGVALAILFLASS